MCSTTEAILFYGVLLEGNDNYPWSDGGGYETEGQWLGAFLNGEQPDLDELSEEAQEPPPEEANIEIVPYGCGNYPAYAIAIKSTVLRIGDGEITPIIDPLNVTSSWIGDLGNFCKDAVGINIERCPPPPLEKEKDSDNKFGWWMVTYWS